ncbi:MAG: TfoX/Sxy family protein [Candidatus Nanopelagicales bacterium]
MAYDVALADRMREALGGRSGMSEKKMFGGLAFLVNGNMAIAASSEGGALVRVDPAESDHLLDTTSATVMVMRGRPMTGWLRVPADELDNPDVLDAWVARGAGYAASLPPKS